MKLALCPRLLMCSRPFRPLGFAHLCRSRPRGSVHLLLPWRLYVDHSHCPRACASYPSCVAVYPRDSRSRRVLCRSSHSLHSQGWCTPRGKKCWYLHVCSCRMSATQNPLKACETCGGDNDYWEVRCVRCALPSPTVKDDWPLLAVAPSVRYRLATGIRNALGFVLVGVVVFIVGRLLPEFLTRFLSGNTRTL